MAVERLDTEKSFKEHLIEKISDFIADTEVLHRQNPLHKLDAKAFADLKFIYETIKLKPANAFNIAYCQRIVSQLASITPPFTEIVETTTSKSFFSTTTNEIKVFLPVANGMKLLIKQLDELIEIAGKEALEKNEAKLQTEREAKKKAKEEKEKAFEERMKRFDQRLQDSEARARESEQQVQKMYKQGIEEGKEIGKHELIVLLKEKARALLPAPYQSQFLQLLDSQSAETINNIPPSAAMPSVSTSTSQMRIKDEDAEKQKALTWIGQPKFQLIAALVDVHNKKQLPAEEGLLIKLLIFQLMLHKHDRTVAQILESVNKNILLEKLGISGDMLARKFPAVTQCLASWQSAEEETLSNAAFTYEELTALYQLVNENALYLPKDGTAANCFGSHASRLKGNTTVELVTEDAYTKNFVRKFSALSSTNQGAHKPQTPAASSIPATSRTMSPTN